LEEQIALLRALWTEDEVSFRGEWHTVVAAGINPLPVQRPIPIWIGGRASAVVERCGRIGDGWIAIHDAPDEQAAAHIAAIRDAARRAGHDPSAVGMEVWVSLGGLTPDDWAAEAEAWRRLGMTHLTVNTEFTAGRHRASDATTVDEHIALLEQYRHVVGEPGAGSN
jgi:alkanesulfonate monooxygenase SsuD/methylene tetrahydromethanopterin reductase-like flavin-dependent oxidoreductase (luciferase family)